MSAGFMRRVVRRVRRLLRPGKAASSSSAYRVVSPIEIAGMKLDGWNDTQVAERQDAAFRNLLAEMHAGRPRIDLQVLAQAVDAAAVDGMSLLEVGCGSGYCSEVIAHLSSKRVEYSGLDYSAAMVELARNRYPEHQFIHGDATALPFGDAAFDIVLNGVALMHIPDYRRAISESARVARRWVIFHTVPVLPQRATTFLTKQAYGHPTVEVIINESELLEICNEQNLVVRHTFPSLPYDLSAVLGEPTPTRTYVCEVAR